MKNLSLCTVLFLLFSGVAGASSIICIDVNKISTGSNGITVESSKGDKIGIPDGNQAAISQAQTAMLGQFKFCKKVQFYKGDGSAADENYIIKH